MFCFTLLTFLLVLGVDIVSVLCFHTIYNSVLIPDLGLWHFCVTKTPHSQYTALRVPGEPPVLPGPREPPDCEVP